jgi:putative transposase
LKAVNNLSRQRLCQLLELPRSSLYYKGVDKSESQAEAARLVECIERIVLSMPGYGYRRVRAQLERDGWHVNHKRVLAVMQRESLLCRLRRRWVRTTDSEHGLRVYPNLIKKLTLDRLDQVWVADITYIRLGNGGFCYLAAVLQGGRLAHRQRHRCTTRCARAEQSA